MTFDGIYLIYNPNSTGNAPLAAKNVAKQLRQAKYTVYLRPTKYAQHAIKLARTIATSHQRPLIVAVGGDGSYHEVVNGVLASGNKKAVCVPYPAGNANDHFFAVTKIRLPELLQLGAVTFIDALRVTIAAPGHDPVTHVCHSYAGVGITATAAKKLNAHSLNRWKELQLMWRTLKEHQPDTIHVNGGRKQIDSILFANIARMAKVFSLVDEQRLHDNKFEVLLQYHQRKRSFIWYMAKMIIRGPKAISVNEYQFTVSHPTAMQLDGELYRLPRKTTVTVQAMANAICTLRPRTK